MKAVEEPACDDKPSKARWDTSYVRPRDRFSYFREGICQAFLACTPLPPDDGNLSATVEMAMFEKGLFARVNTTPHKVIRTRADFSNLPTDLLSLALTQTGETRGIADGTLYHRRRNQLDLLSAGAIECFDIIGSERYSLDALAFPRHYLRGIKLSRKCMTLNHSHSDVLTSALRLISRSFDDGSRKKLNCLVDASIALLNARLVDDPDLILECTSTNSTSEGILLTIKDHILQNLDDPNLTTDTVAKNFNISSRYLQQLFAHEQTTFRSFLTERRLEKVARDLVDPNVPVDVADVALRWGFRDLTTFHRNFKRHFSDTPKQMRKRAGAMIARS